MKHRAAVRFWDCYRALPPQVRRLADNAFETLKANAHHPSLQLKQVGPYWSVRVGLHYRALAVQREDELVCHHAKYDRLVGM